MFNIVSLFSFSLVGGFSCHNGPTHDDLTIANTQTTTTEVYYLNEAPYDGVITTYHSMFSTLKKRESTYTTGMLDGEDKSWHNNGQLQKQITWKDGRRDGLTSKWYRNGNQQSEVTYKVIINPNREEKESFCCYNQTYWNEDGSQRLRSWKELMNDKDLETQANSDVFIQDFRKKFNTSPFTTHCSSDQQRDLNTINSVFIQYLMIMNSKEAAEQNWNINIGVIKRVLQVFLKEYTADELRKVKDTGMMAAHQQNTNIILSEKDCAMYIDFAVTFWNKDKLNLPPEAKR